MQSMVNSELKIQELADDKLGIKYDIRHVLGLGTYGNCLKKIFKNCMNVFKLDSERFYIYKGQLYEGSDEN